MAISPLPSSDVVRIKVRLDQKMCQPSHLPAAAIVRRAVAAHDKWHRQPEVSAHSQYAQHVARSGVGRIEMLPNLIGQHDVELAYQLILGRAAPVTDAIFGKVEPPKAMKIAAAPIFSQNFSRAHRNQMQRLQPLPRGALHHDPGQ